MIMIDMDMPKNCEVCQFRFSKVLELIEGPEIINLCTVKMKAIKDLHKRPEICPLIEVKGPIEESVEPLAEADDEE